MRLYSSFAVCAALSLSGCLATTGGPKTTIATAIPAGSSEATRIKDIAVLPFDGYQGRELSIDLEGTLAGVKLGDVPYFRVAERARLDSVFKEIKLSQSGVINREQTLKLGKLLGVKGLYAGSVGQPVTHESHYQESRSTCAEEDPNKVIFGIIRSCKRWAETKVSCSKHDVVYSFTPKLIEIESGKILYSNNIKGTANSASCQDQQTPAPTTAQLLEVARNNAFAQFRRDVAPSSIVIAIQLFDSTDGIRNDLARTRLVQGLEFAKANRLDRACELWKEAQNAESSSVSILYNLAICEESMGHLAEAAELYGRADRLLEHPDERVSTALARVANAKRDSTKLVRQVGNY